MMTDMGFAERLQKLALREGMTFATLATLGARDRAAVLATIMARFDPPVVYAERDVNERLEGWLAGEGANIETDHVTLRRWLVDTAAQSRPASGSGA